MRNYFFFFIFLVLLSCKTEEQKPQPVFKTVFETSNGQQTATYEEVIEFYLKLAKNTPEINVQTIGETDSGKPLHLVTYNADGIFNFQKLGADKLVVLINNGIHPGESDGIDATMLLFRDLASNFLKGPKNIVVVTIPVYNVGGMLDRNSWTRANQNGPKAYGFRGNAQNYDLNRDFIKSDTKNASTFSTIFHLTQPDLFIDNHVSNGANYQYTLTHLFTQHNKLGGSLGTYLNEEMMPGLTEELGKANWDITPYVNVFNRPPETGFDQFLDHPRYSTGYTTLWNTLGMMVETHMLKPYKQRVLGTYQVLSSMLNIAARDRKKIKDLRNRAL
ncbi:MAG: M14 family metallopeptidase, partial [Croceitalea sp.]|nr:M14 family metallopeptidase [Croceitalea sp.]